MSSPNRYLNMYLLLFNSMPEFLVIIFFVFIFFFSGLVKTYTQLASAEWYFHVSSTRSSEKKKDHFVCAYEQIYRFVETWQMHFLHNNSPLWLNIKIELYISLSALAFFLPYGLMRSMHWYVCESVSEFMCSHWIAKKK